MKYEVFYTSAWGLGVDVIQVGHPMTRFYFKGEGGIAKIEEQALIDSEFYELSKWSNDIDIAIKRYNNAVRSKDHIKKHADRIEDLGDEVVSPEWIKEKMALLALGS